MESSTELFDQLKVHFGNAGDADQLSFDEFVALPDDRANRLLNRECVPDKIAGILAKLRDQEKQKKTQGNQGIEIVEIIFRVLDRDSFILSTYTLFIIIVICFIR